MIDFQLDDRSGVAAFVLKTLSHHDPAEQASCARWSWPFQLIESGAFTGLSAVVLAVAVWWILRRVA